MILIFYQVYPRTSFFQLISSLQLSPSSVLLMLNFIVELIFTTHDFWCFLADSIKLFGNFYLFFQPYQSLNDKFLSILRFYNSLKQRHKYIFIEKDAISKPLFDVFSGMQILIAKSNQIQDLPNHEFHQGNFLTRCFISVDRQFYACQG